MSIDIEHLKTWIGKTESESEHLTPSLVKRFGATFDMTPDTNKGAPAPSLIHLCLCNPTPPSSELGPDGHPKRGGFLPPVPLPNRMWAGGEFTFGGDLIIGDRVTRNSTIKDVTLKKGRTGQLCFVTVEHQIMSGQDCVLTEIHNIVYREDSGESEKPQPQRAEQGTHTSIITPTTPFLFRYSALTFNTHRIHYDAPYSSNIENYPGLIVHGPLQATLLVQMAEKLRGLRPEKFQYRNLSTIFDTGDFTLNASDKDADGGGEMRLWTAQAGGPVAMDAKASW